MFIGLDYLRGAGVTPDERVAEAIELVASKRDGDGCGRFEIRYPGVIPVETDEGEGCPTGLLGNVSRDPTQTATTS